MQLHDMMTRKAAASEQVDKAGAVARSWLESRGAVMPKIETTTTTAAANPPLLVGRVKFAGPDPIRTTRTSATGEDLYRKNQ